MARRASRDENASRNLDIYTYKLYIMKFIDMLKEASRMIKIREEFGADFVTKHADKPSNPGDYKKIVADVSSKIDTYIKSLK